MEPIFFNDRIKAKTEIKTNTVKSNKKVDRKRKTSSNSSTDNDRKNKKQRLLTIHTSQ